uniref:Uncharacterized protein n=1 Tax=Ditylenchus dipsaci TaxID=166011 RepID=A0A915CKV6_9BILA
MPNLLDLSSNVIAESGKERKDADIPPFIDLSEELKKGKQLGSPTNVSTGAVVNKVDNKIQSNNDSPSDKDTINEKKQKILYMAAAISMATMAASEGVLRLSKLEKIVSSVFGGHAKPELYGHKDWISFINQHCRKNIQVIQKNTHEAVLICITSDEGTS